MIRYSKLYTLDLNISFICIIELWPIDRFYIVTQAYKLLLGLFYRTTITTGMVHIELYTLKSGNKKIVKKFNFIFMLYNIEHIFVLKASWSITKFSYFIISAKGIPLKIHQINMSLINYDIFH